MRAISSVSFTGARKTPVVAGKEDQTPPVKQKRRTRTSEPKASNDTVELKKSSKTPKTNPEGTVKATAGKKTTSKVKATTEGTVKATAGKKTTSKVKATTEGTVKATASKETASNVKATSEEVVKSTEGAAKKAPGAISRFFQKIFGPGKDSIVTKVRNWGKGIKKAMNNTSASMRKTLKSAVNLVKKRDALDYANARSADKPSSNWRKSRVKKAEKRLEDAPKGIVDSIKELAVKVGEQVKQANEYVKNFVDDASKLSLSPTQVKEISGLIELEVLKAVKVVK